MSAAAGAPIRLTEKGQPRCIGRVCGTKRTNLPGKIARYEEEQCARACMEGDEFCKVCFPRFLQSEAGMPPNTWHGRFGGPIPERSLIVGGPRNTALRAKAAEEAEKAAKKAAALTEKALAAMRIAEEKAVAAARKEAAKAEAAMKKLEREVAATARKAATEARKAEAVAKRATTQKARRKTTGRKKTARRSNSSSSSSSSSNSSSSNSSRRSTSSSSSSSSNSSRRSTSRRPLALGNLRTIPELMTALHPRGNTPISNISAATSPTSQIYRPASAGSAISAPRSPAYATPMSSEVSENVTQAY
jgi:hypothetical protein